MLAMVMLLLAQDIGPPGDEPEAPTRITPRRSCQPKAEYDIVVCGNSLASQRMEPLPDWPSDPVFQPAEARLSPNKKLNLHAKQANNPFSESPRAMISFKLDF